MTGAGGIAGPKLALVLEKPLAEIAPPQPGEDPPAFDDVLPAKGGLFLFAGSERVFAIDHAGKLLFEKRFEGGWHEPPYLAGERLCVRTADALVILGPDGAEQARIPAPECARESRVTEDGAYFLTSTSLEAYSFGTKQRRKLVAEHVTNQAHIAAVTADAIVLQLSVEGDGESVPSGSFLASFRVR